MDFHNFRFLPLTKNRIETTQNKQSTGLSTFEGVFTPSILTILGVIMYLRFGWVVGNVGLIGTLIIVTLSTSITFLTALSIASISTDQKVKTGGAYYMISRSLGLETGGAVGIPLYIAQTLSVALYTIGFAESVSNVFPSLDQTAVGLVVTLFVGILALTSARIAVRSQFFILAAIAISLLSLVFGSPLEETEIEMWGVPASSSVGFWNVFAVFFPAVTGIMAGVNMSGDLKNSAKAIPKGTFMAIGVGYAIYMGLPIILANRVDASTLVADPLIMRKISFWGDAILLGVWGATLSSAMGSILGAPRVLQALVRDGVLPKNFQWLGRGTGEDDNPRAGTIFTLLIALIAVYLGNLDIIAPILTMFFLATYGVLNISAGLEKFLGSPSFRPVFRVHWIFSLLGAGGCLAVMFLINPLATVIAIIFLLGVFTWLERRNLRATWGDVREGIWLALIRSGLVRLSGKLDPKNWRPHMLVLSGAPTKRWHLIAFTNQIIQNRGLMTVSTVLANDEGISAERQQSMELNVREYLLSRGINSMVRVITAEDPYIGAERLVSTYGLGALVPNTIIMGYSLEKSHHDDYCRMISGFYEANRSVLIMKENTEKGFGQFRMIDVWWGGLKGNGALMIILAHMLRRSIEWGRATLRLNMVVDSKQAAEDAHENIEDLVKRVRIDIQSNIIVSYDQPFPKILHKNSEESDLVVLGLAKPGKDFKDYYERLGQMSENLPTTLFVLAASDMDFEEVLL